MDEELKSSQVKLIISGMVQMVGFRFFAVRTARKLGITGYVRNLPGGDVEISAEGYPERLEQFIAAVTAGPPSARVTGVRKEWDDALPQCSDFSIRW